MTQTKAERDLRFTINILLLVVLGFQAFKTFKS